MELAFLNSQQLPVALAALQSVASWHGRLAESERSLLEVVAEMHGSRLELETVPRLDPVTLSAVVEDPHQRKRLVQMAMVMAMVEGDVSIESIDENRLKALVASYSARYPYKPDHLDGWFVVRPKRVFAIPGDLREAAKFTF